MRASRLLSILLLLQTRGRMTAQALADEFETSIRTIYRDIDHLSAAGVPVYADRGRSGGFQLLEGYRTRLTGLSPAEAETLFLSGLPGAAADLGLGDAMAAAQLKLLAALPAEGRIGAARIGSRFHLDPIGWYRNAEHTEVLPALAEAVWTARRIRIRYDAWTGVTERELEPLGLALKAGVWYVVAQAGGKPRTYRVSNIQALELAPETFERPAAFDLPAYWQAWVRDFEARLYKGEATLRLSPAGLKAICNISPAAERAARAATDVDAAGWARVVVPIESIENAASDFLKLGADAEVLAPPDLRARMGEIAGRLKAIYAAEGA
ncbi:MAG: WYL domain-containing protein [Alphaproteobacteria bacterium]|nr:WYL domain-containing protein [Alphaproteobacteria bacterium]MBU1516235.1 WYL domain-containing protein [Alphaproteobacteria bacterium]MBU2095772.1 WYL domain-containing protein [Alphaproteobacteria bacterium]MBU2151989.1 WYL domain-containing protein [Alphaproteobacteria bacterium]MBU2306829.1 WYL domain-containing protein [Alphaproteobacteria bacterium]